MNQVVNSPKTKGNQRVHFGHKYETDLLNKVPWEQLSKSSTDKEHVLNTWNFVKKLTVLIFIFEFDTLW